jgi:hypothetical protein
MTTLLAIGRPLLRHTKTFSVAAAILLGGCAHPPTVTKYTAAQGPDSVRLMVRGAVANPGAFYGVYLFADPEQCKGMQRVGLGNANAHPATTRIRTDKLSTVEVLYTLADRRSCRGVVSFWPKAKHDYLVSTRIDASHCTISLLDASDPDHMKPEPSALARDQGAQLCLPLDKSKPLASAANAVKSDKKPELVAPLPVSPDKNAAPVFDESLNNDLKGLAQ